MGFPAIPDDNIAAAKLHHRVHLSVPSRFLSRKPVLETIQLADLIPGMCVHVRGNRVHADSNLCYARLCAYWRG